MGMNPTKPSSSAACFPDSGLFFAILFTVAGLVSLPSHARLAPVSQVWDYQKLEPCQRRLIEGIPNFEPQFSSQWSNKILDAARAGYRNLSSYDEYFIVRNKLDAYALSTVKDLAIEFSMISCGEGLKDGKPSNAFVHAGLAMAASVYMGPEKACEWSTGHELFLNKPLVVAPHKQSPVPYTNRVSDNYKMDLINNAAGLRLAKSETKLVHDCVEMLRLRLRAKQQAYIVMKPGHPIATRELLPIGSKASYLLAYLNPKQTLMMSFLLKDNQDKAESCQVLSDKLKGSETTLSFLKVGSCKPRSEVLRGPVMPGGQADVTERGGARGLAKPPRRIAPPAPPESAGAH